MPNEYVRKTNRGMAGKESYELAYEAVTLRGQSLRSAALSYNLNYMSLSRYIKKKNNFNDNLTDQSPTVGYVSPTVFTPEEEKILCEYMLTCSASNFGLKTKEMRKLAYKLAKQYNKNFPASWEKLEMAGEVWLQLFMKRHDGLSLRLSQPTSIARATSFNKINVTIFFDNYKDVLSKYAFDAKDIWNIIETGIATVQRPDRVIARRGEKQISAMMSAEGGTLVTLALAGNAIGNYIPPIFIFPRKKFQEHLVRDVPCRSVETANGSGLMQEDAVAGKAIGNYIPPIFKFPRKRFQEHFVRDGPRGSVGTANDSGWMQEDDFFFFLNHFKTHVRPSKEHRKLLLLDNHSSHMALKNIEFCRENGIVLLTFPPHCTHKLQPMDRTVFGPLKKAINIASDSWMQTNPGKVMSVYDIPSLAKTAFDVAITAENIKSGFAATGIWPVKTNIFEDDDFQPSQVTDSQPNVAITTPDNEDHSTREHFQSTSSTGDILEPVASTSRNRNPLNTISNVYSPEILRPS